MSLGGAAPVFCIAAGPKAPSKPTTPVARMTDRHHGAGTVESRRGFIIPASKGLHRKPDAQPSMRTLVIVPRTMAVQWREWTSRALFPEVLPQCNDRRQGCERMSYDIKRRLF
jgi:hypothetical protein